MICPICDRDAAELFTWSWRNGQVEVTPTDDGMCKRCMANLGMVLYSFASGSVKDRSGASIRRRR